MGRLGTVRTLVLGGLGLALAWLGTPAAAAGPAPHLDAAAATRAPGLSLTFSGGLPGLAGSSSTSTITRCSVTRPDPKDKKFVQWSLQGTVTVNGTPFTLSLQIGKPAVKVAPVPIPGQPGPGVDFFSAPAIPFRGPRNYSTSFGSGDAVIVRLVGDPSRQVPVTAVSNTSVNGRTTGSFVSASGIAIENWSLGETGGTIDLKTVKSGSLNLSLAEQVINVTYPTPGHAGIPVAPPLQVQGTFNC